MISGGIVLSAEQPGRLTSSQMAGDRYHAVLLSRWLCWIGKSHSPEYLADLQSSPVKFACATGKAARVLTKKGCPAVTVHSLIYTPGSDINDEIRQLEETLLVLLEDLKDEALPKTKKSALIAKEDKIYARLAKLREPRFVLNEMQEDDPDPDPKFKIKRRKHPLDGVGLLVLDEVSMLNHEVATDLMSFNIPMLVLGDPGQLPPVKGAGYFTNRTPDFMLTEIHRQAAGNPIIQLATMFREGKTPKTGSYGQSRVTTRFKLTDEDFISVDQVLCGSNKNRISLNAKIRTLRGFSGPYPQAGERLVCLRNNPKNQVLNGQIFVATEDFDPKTGILMAEDDDGREFELRVHPECFTRPAQVQAWDYRKRSEKNEFDWAWSLTVHKFQGSESDSVLVYGDACSWMRDRTELRCWCYTACTRAAERLIFAL